MKRGMVLTMIGVVVVAFCSQGRTLADANARVVHFPADRSMGVLYVVDSNLLDMEDASPPWERLCEATGDVTAPAGKALRLNLSKQASEDLTPLSRLGANDIQVLYCRDVEMADDQLQHISNLTGLAELSLYGTGILGTGLKHLANLDSLKRLRLGKTHVGDNELAHLMDLDSLMFLDLRSTPTTDAGMVHVGKITSLEILPLGRGVGDSGLRHLRNLTSLRSLSVMDESISDEGLSHLAQMTQMESLYIQKTQVSNEGLVHLKQMTKLKRLHLWGTRVTQEGLIHLKHLRDIEQLRVSFDIDTGLKYLSEWTSLKTIRIDAGLMTPKELGVLSKMKSLKEIYLNCSKSHSGDNTSQVLKELAKLLELKSLTIGRGLTDEGLVNIATMQSLQELRIMEAEITGEGIAALAEMPSLRKLSFSEAQLPSVQQWEALGKLSALENLDLFFMRSSITDRHIAHLSGLHRLKNLAVSSGYELDEDGYGILDITDKGLTHISKLKTLERLYISGANEITEQGLQQLAGLPALQHITLENCGVSEDGLQPLKEKLPALRWSVY